MSDRQSDPRSLLQAIQAGDLLLLQRMLDERPASASEPIPCGKGRTRTPLHVATDWPGYFPSAPEAVRRLIRAGADPNARVTGGRFAETPLHWAASSDDSDVAEALIEGGADIEAPGGSIAGGTPLDNAVGYACWNVARLLVARGARVESLWHAAALGMSACVERLVARDPVPSREALSQAFWHACSGGQRRTAEYLLGLGADIDFIPSYSHSKAVEAAAALDTRRQGLIDWLREPRT